MVAKDMKLGTNIEELLGLLEEDMSSDEDITDLLDGLYDDDNAGDFQPSSNSSEFQKNDERVKNELFHKGLSAMKAGDFLMASAFFLAMDVIGLSDVKTLNNLGVSLFRLGRISEAESMLERAMVMDPDNQITKRNLEKIKQFRRRDQS